MCVAVCVLWHNNETCTQSAGFDSVYAVTNRWLIMTSRSGAGRWTEGAGSLRTRGQFGPVWTYTHLKVTAATGWFRGFLLSLDYIAYLMRVNELRLTRWQKNPKQVHLQKKKEYNDEVNLSFNYMESFSVLHLMNMKCLFCDSKLFHLGLSTWLFFFFTHDALPAAPGTLIFEIQTPPDVPLQGR